MKEIIQYNKLLSSYKKNDDSSFLNLLYSLIFDPNSDLPYPDTVTFNIIIDYCGKNNLLDDMFEFFFVMMESGYRPTIFTFASMMNGFAKNASYMYRETISQHLNYILEFMTFMGVDHNEFSHLAYNKCVSRMKMQPINPLNFIIITESTSEC